MSDDDDIGWFYQVSDVIPKEFFVEFTKDCPTKDECCMSGRQMQTTLMGTAHHYDSKGQLHVWDKNRQKVQICCDHCWKAGTVSNREKSDEYKVEIIKEAGEMNKQREAALNRLAEMDADLLLEDDE